MGTANIPLIIFVAVYIIYTIIATFYLVEKNLSLEARIEYLEKAVGPDEELPSQNA